MREEERPLLDPGAPRPRCDRELVNEEGHLDGEDQGDALPREAGQEEERLETTTIVGAVRMGRTRTHSLVVARVCTARTAW